MRNATSHKVGAYKSDSAVTTGVAAYNQLGYQRSAIDDLLTSTYNYSIELPFNVTNQNWFNQSKKPAGATAVNNKLTFNVDNFNVANNELLSTKTAIDYVRDVIGIQKVINSSLLTDTTVWLRDAIGLSAGNFKQLSLSESKDYKSVAENELTTTILQKSGEAESQNLIVKALKVPEKLTSVNAYTWMSRKAKTLADRITATEMELDVLTKVIVNKDEGFEARDVREVLDTIIQKANNADHSALNLWLEDLHKYPQYNPAQTQKLLNYLERYCEYVSEEKVKDGKKVISFKQVKDIPAYDADYKGYNHTKETVFTVTLVYSEAKSVDQGTYEIAIYTPTNKISKDLVRLATINDDIGAGIDYNYSYHASKELALMKEMMKQNLQATYDIKYPVGGYVYFEGDSYKDAKNNPFPYTEDDHKNYAAMGIKEREFKLVDDKSGVAQSTGIIPSITTDGTVDLSGLALQNSTQKQILAARDDAIKSTIKALLDNHIIDITNNGNVTGIQKTEKAGILLADTYIQNTDKANKTYTQYSRKSGSLDLPDAVSSTYKNVKAVIADVSITTVKLESGAVKKIIRVTWKANLTPYTKTTTTYKPGSSKGQISSLTSSGNLVTANFIGSAKYTGTPQTSNGFYVSGNYSNSEYASELADNNLKTQLWEKLQGIYELSLEQPLEISNLNTGAWNKIAVTTDSDGTDHPYQVLFLVSKSNNNYSGLQDEEKYLFDNVNASGEIPDTSNWQEDDLTPEEKKGIWKYVPSKEIAEVNFNGLTAQVNLNGNPLEYEGLDINVSDSDLEATIFAKYSSYGYTTNIIQNIASKAESFPIDGGSSKAAISASVSNVDVTVGNNKIKCFKVL